MSGLTKRHFITGGLVAIAAIAGAGYVMGTGPGGATASGTAGAFEHRFLTVDEMKADGALIVDIRTPPEWSETGVIEGAKLVEFDFNNPASFLPRIAADLGPDQELVIICRSGNRTQAAGDYISKKIPNKVVSVNGGMKAVIASGYKPVPPA